MTRFLPLIALAAALMAAPAPARAQSHLEELQKQMAYEQEQAALFDSIALECAKDIRDGKTYGAKEGDDPLTLCLQEKKIAEVEVYIPGFAEVQALEASGGGCPDMTAVEGDAFAAPPATCGTCSAN